MDEFCRDCFNYYCCWEKDLGVTDEWCSEGLEPVWNEEIGSLECEGWRYNHHFDDQGGE